jgi:hypothetical protein
VTNDLGLQIIWSVDDAGVYTAKWEVPLSAPPGSYRFVVSAKKYQLSSKAFAVAPSRALEAKEADGVVRLAYPKPVVNVDITYRPEFASGGTARFLVDGKPRVVKAIGGGRFAVPAGAKVELPAGAAHDRYGNTNGTPLS